MAKAASESAPNRLVSLDAYRGFTMLLLASGGLGLAKLENDPAWGPIARQFEHRSWLGCTFWDLIQPSFMFIVGVSMVFSYYARQGQGQTWARQMVHVVKRAALLCAIGIFLDWYTSSPQKVEIQFIRVLQQIAIGYVIAFLVVPLGPKAQGVAAIGLLAAHTAAFLIYGHLTGHDPWDKEHNVGRQIDAILRLPLSGGYYATFNAVSATATILFGVLIGELLRSPAGHGRKIGVLIGVGAFGLAAGWLLSGGGGWIPFEFPTAVPMIKRLWTSSFAVFAAGWTCWMLAGFYLLIDAAGWKLWAFPFLVVGMNSIATYVMVSMFRSSANRVINLIIPVDKLTAESRLIDYLPVIDFSNLTVRYGIDLKEWKFTPVVAGVLAMILFWLVLLWLYRRKIFFKL